MAKYKVTDPQSGKSVIVSGDSPPSDDDLEGIFQEAGLRTDDGMSQQPQTISQNLQQNPVSNFLLGNSLRISQDASSGINANMTEDVRTKRNKEAFQQAKKFEESAAVTQDPMIKKKLLSQANDIYSQVSKAEQEVSQSFSPAVRDNPLLRGAASGLEIATLAETLYRAPGAVRAIGRAGKAVLHPFKTVGAIKERAIESAMKEGKSVDGNKILKVLEKERSSVPPTEIEQYDKMYQSAVRQLYNKQLPVDTASKMLSRSNDAYTAAGAVKDSAKAAFEKVTGDSIRSQLPKDVLKANQLFRKLYGIQGVAKKVVNPYTIGVGALATAGSYLGGKLLGK